jgi:hypothetical protein
VNSLNVNQKIEKLLKSGYQVVSLAAGRVGHVTDATASTVTISPSCRRRGRSAQTTFAAGDPIKLYWSPEARQWIVSNDWPAMGAVQPQ